MALERKLKPDRSIGGAIIPISMPIIFALIALLFEFSVALKVAAVMVALFFFFYLYMLLRTGNLHLLVVVCEALFFTFMFWLISQRYGFGDLEWQRTFEIAMRIGVITFGILLIYFGLNRRLQWRGREIFELAAESVEETGDGYTHRPCPVGRVDYSLHQLRGFARFCAKHMIALPYITSKSITLVPMKMGDEFFRLLGLLGDYRDASWVNFDVNGEVSVHITQKDYLEYREPLAFDKLCASFGQLFIEFLELYSNGEGIRAVDRMDELKIPLFS
jgi:hypothetical protein